MRRTSKMIDRRRRSRLTYGQSVLIIAAINLLFSTSEERGAESCTYILPSQNWRRMGEREIQWWRSFYEIISGNDGEEFCFDEKTFRFYWFHWKQRRFIVFSLKKRGGEINQNEIVPRRMFPEKRETEKKLWDEISRTQIFRAKRKNKKYIFSCNVAGGLSVDVSPPLVPPGAGSPPPWGGLVLLLDDDRMTQLSLSEVTLIWRVSWKKDWQQWKRSLFFIKLLILRYFVKIL